MTNGTSCHFVKDMTSLPFFMFHNIAKIVSIWFDFPELHADEPTLLDCESALRKSFSVKKKYEYVVAFDVLMAKGASHQQACLMVGLPHNYYPCFKKVIKKLDYLEQDAGFVPFKANGTARKIHPGHPSLLQAIQEDLSHFVFEIRQCGIQVSTNIIQQEACLLLLSFGSKSMEARKRIVIHFTKTMGILHQTAMHAEQKNFQETEEESRHFIEMMKDKVM